MNEYHAVCFFRSFSSLLRLPVFENMSPGSGANVTVRTRHFPGDKVLLAMINIGGDTYVLGMGCQVACSVANNTTNPLMDRGNSNTVT